MKNSWTLEELAFNEFYGAREELLLNMRRVSYIKRPFRKLRYVWKCSKILLEWLYWDMLSNRDWFWFKPTEEFERAKAQKFENYRWICKSEKWLTEYTFRLEWIFGLWSPEKADLELTSIDFTSDDWKMKEFGKNLACYLDLDYEKSRLIIEELMNSTPVVIMKDVQIRSAYNMKKGIEIFRDVTVSVLPKEES